MIHGKAAELTAVCAISVGMSGTVFAASSTFEMRKKTVSLLGIINTSNESADPPCRGRSRGC